MSTFELLRPLFLKGMLSAAATLLALLCLRCSQAARDSEAAYLDACTGFCRLSADCLSDASGRQAGSDECIATTCQSELETSWLEPEACLSSLAEMYACQNQRSCEELNMLTPGCEREIAEVDGQCRAAGDDLVGVPLIGAELLVACDSMCSQLRACGVQKLEPDCEDHCFATAEDFEGTDLEFSTCLEQLIVWANCVGQADCQSIESAIACPEESALLICDPRS